MREEVKTEALLNCLQSMLDDYVAERDRYGVEDRVVKTKLEWMIGAKELVEAVICAPVNLQKDGKVTVGF